jgi:penicillin-binding protein 2
MQVRVVALAVVVGVFFLILAGRLWHLQVLTGDEYDLYAQNTHTRSVKISAQRGVIYDRDGEALANNGPGLNVTIVPDSTSREKVEELAGILGADKETVLERYAAALKTNRYEPMLLKENAGRDAVTYVSERRERYRGLVVNDDYVRNYPHGSLAAHVLGYTGAVTEDELKQEGFEGLGSDAVVGKGGVELQYEEVLRGKPGSYEYDVDALGRQVALRRADGSRYDGEPEGIAELGRPARTTEPEPGKDLRLTLDLDLQRAAEAELDAAIARAQTEGYSGSGGAIVAMDPRNGEILAMASRPTFDPQLFVGGISGDEEMEQFEYLNSPYANAPFTSRAVGGSYPAASTFKAFTGLAGLETGAIDENTTVTDTGACWLPAGVVAGCWQSWREFAGTGTTHGTQNFEEALMDSNDKFFYQVADWMWNRTEDENLLPKYYKKWGFGETTGVDLPGEAAGRVPTRQWQEEAGSTPEDKYWSVGRWVNMAIGQGDLSVTPLQLIRGYAAIENGGTLVTPHVGLDVRDRYGKVERKIRPKKPAEKVDVSPEHLRKTVEGLRLVTGPNGTAAPAFQDSELSVAGKSGTGEIAGKDPVNWFVGWAEGRSRPLVVLAMVEGGGNSEVTGAPAVRHVLEAYHGVEHSPTDIFPAAPVEGTDAAAAPNVAGTGG